MNEVHQRRHLLSAAQLRSDSGDDAAESPATKLPRSILSRAIIASEQGRPAAVAVWTELLELCQAKEHHFLELFFSDEYLSSKSPAERLLASPDWESKILVFDQIPEGTYQGGKILRTPQGMYELKNHTRSGFGIERNALVTYCGQFLEGEKSGLGRQLYISGDGYEGEWRKNSPCGWGTMFPPGNPQKTKTGIFYDHMYLGNPNEQPKNKIRQKLSTLAERYGLKNPLQQKGIYNNGNH